MKCCNIKITRIKLLIKTEDTDKHDTADYMNTIQTEENNSQTMIKQ